MKSERAAWAFPLLLAVPALIMLADFMRLPSWGLLLDRSGEWAVRMLILTLAVTPVRLLMRRFGMGPYWPMWLLKRRRDLGLAAFLYAALHLSTYLIRQSNLNVVLFDMWYREYATGWIAFITMMMLAATSNDRSVHGLGTWWKPLQRLVYVAIIAVLLHWYWIRLDHQSLWLHAVPLAALEAFRLWHDFARPAGMRQ